LVALDAALAVWSNGDLAGVLDSVGSLTDDGIWDKLYGQIDNAILTHRVAGMLTLDASIERLLHQGKISRETAERFASSPERLF